MDSVGELRDRAAGAELARVAVGSAMAKAEERLRTTGGAGVAELERLTDAREAAMGHLSDEEMIQFRADNARAVAEQAIHLLQTEGSGGGVTVAVAGMMTSLANDMGYPSGYSAYHAVVERLDTLRVLLGDRAAARDVGVGDQSLKGR